MIPCSLIGSHQHFPSSRESKMISGIPGDHLPPYTTSKPQNLQYASSRQEDKSRKITCKFSMTPLTSPPSNRCNVCLCVNVSAVETWHSVPITMHLQYLKHISASQEQACYIQEMIQERERVCNSQTGSQCGFVTRKQTLNKWALSFLQMFTKCRGIILPVPVAARSKT
jgi:hypothetical protein